MSKSFVFAILDWARSKPADEAYDYFSCANCVVAQFLRDTGRADDPRVGAGFWRERGTEVWHDFDPRVDDAADAEPATFGAFADRLAEQVLV